MTEERRSELMDFKSDMARFYSELEELEVGVESLSPAQTELERYGPAQMALVAARTRAMPGWKSIPTYLSLVQTMNQQPGTAAPANESELELFRAQMESEVTQLQDRGLVPAQAREQVRNFPAEQLQHYYQLLGQTPANKVEPMRELLASIIANPETPSAAVADCFTGNTVDVCPKIVFVPQECFPEVCFDPCIFPVPSCAICTPAFCSPELSLNPFCPITLPGINASCVGNEITSAATNLTNQFTGQINGLENSITSVVQEAITAVSNLGADIAGIATDIEGFATGVSTGIGDLATDVIGEIGGFTTDLVNDIAGFVSEVGSELTSAVDSVTDFVTGIPEALEGFFGDIIDAALGPFDLNLTPEGFFNLLKDDLENIVDNLPNVPELPCPPNGTEIPLIGTVGDGDASNKFDDLVWLQDWLYDLVPETEWTAVVLIPYDIAIAAASYLNLCLQNAATLQDEDNTNQFRSDVNAAFAARTAEIDSKELILTERIDLARTNLSQLLEEATTELSTRGASVKTSILNLTNTVETDVTNLVNSTEASLVATVGSTTDTLSNSIDGATTSLINAINNRHQHGDNDH